MNATSEWTKAVEGILTDLFNYKNTVLNHGFVNEQATIEQALEAIRRVTDEVIGEDENAEWQVIWQGGKKTKIDDPEITGRNELRAEQRKLLKGDV